ncbi:putative 3-oxoacyl-acyl carrier protein synthase (Beta-ketoacyl-ACP synthase), FabF-like [Bradyrhizobium sp. ORS 278]|uniref:beta-ketoacyl-ACP synthase n=1 Tax=Bradyrhizobium sp. (strain ORS 278) TaxID=114615 RepID=UPI0001507F5E|nr:beta-ketoacyl-ACP synthase [Bradyrhizobium sp. ORS 278]CAL78407.1 putative 3-oxoacyl-acyl carrier protein synthase (Beta-ketoacyl-ACP synthase), FabF-like [Bradyrhizobium sp. ORS 278]
MSETPSVTSAPVEVWITGIGLATSLGEGLDANWEALNAGQINVDEQGFAPYIVHPWAKVNLEAQIPKKEQRQMEAWQRIGTYAAGLALDSAGLKGNKDILSRMDMIVAAGGGERDISVDTAILNAEAAGNCTPGFLNDRLMSDLRPTLFLAQLSNLLAGNIAISHGVCGTSRTFMGEEVAGVDAFKIALARIAGGQSDIALVGGSHNGERKDLLVLYEFGDYNLKNEFKPVWARKEHPGFALGSAGAFLVLESKPHAEARGAKPLARLSKVVADRARRKEAGAVTGTLDRLWSALDVHEAPGAIITGATGAEPVTSEERAFLDRHKAFAVRSSGTRFGHTMEAHFALDLALAALSISRGALFAPGDTSGVESEMNEAPAQIVVVGAGHYRGEGMALVEAVK